MRLEKMEVKIVKLDLEAHACMLGKLVGNLLMIEMAARLMVAKCAAGGDLGKTRPVFSQLTEGAWVDITSISNKEDLTWALDNYNRCVKCRQELKVDKRAIVFLRDVLAHGRTIGLGKPTFDRALTLFKFGRDVKDKKVQVTLRVDMTKDWFDKQSKMLLLAFGKMKEALDFESKEL